MVKGVNESGEESHYIYNGLGHLVGNEWIVAKNAYGYSGVSTDPSKQVDGVVRVCTAHKNTSDQGHQNPTGAGHFKDKGETNDGGSTTGGTTDGTTGGTTPTISNKHAVVHKDYVIDYTSALSDVIMETDLELYAGTTTGGLTDINNQTNYTNVPAADYRRRSDLMDPSFVKELPLYKG